MSEEDFDLEKERLKYFPDAKPLKIKKPIYKKWWFWVLAVFAFFILVGIISGGGDNKQTTSPPESKSASSTVVPAATEDTAAKQAAEEKKKQDAEAEVKADAEAKAKVEADKKAKEEADKKAAEEAAKNPKWNTSEMDATKNGNVVLAINMIKALGDYSDKIENADAGLVFKAPWNYYGKAIKFTGYAGIVQEYPPTSDIGKTGLIAEVVLITDDGSIIDSFSMVGTGKIKVGDTVTVTGFPVGQVEVQNKMGGKTTQLAVVTNKVE